jgi:uncharacterized protein with FMN-binding domain
MKRAPIVLAGTAVGLAGVLAYHTSPSPTVLVGSSTATASRATTTGAAATAPTTSSTGATSHSTRTVTTSHQRPTAPKTRSAIGQDVSYQYGDLQVKVTKSGTRITGVSLVRHDVNDPRSQSIDQFAIPQLQKEAVTSQGAKVDGVSGASYTSAAYEQSLQSALDKLA